MSKTGTEGYPPTPKYSDAERWIGFMVTALDATGVGFGGFSVKARDDEVMMVLRGLRDTEAVVSFVFSDDLGGLLRKALNRARGGRLRWRADQYQSNVDSGVSSG